VAAALGLFKPSKETLPMKTKWLLSAAGSALACMIVTTTASAAPAAGTMKLDTPAAQVGGATVQPAHWYGRRHHHWRHWGWRHHRHGWHRGW